MFNKRERVKYIISTERVKFTFTGKEGLNLSMFTERERVKTKVFSSTKRVKFIINLEGRKG